MKKLTHLFMCAIIIGVCNANNPLARIVHGEDADIKDYPYQVSIRQKSSRSNLPPMHICGGAIIDENHIITAAHCFKHFKNLKDALKQVTVHAASSRLDVEGSVYNFMDIVKHPEYKPRSSKYDIAIIKLNKSIVFTDTQKPIQLPSQDFENGMVGTVTGWGDTVGFRRRRLSNILQKLPLKVFDKENCKNIQDSAADLPDTESCGFTDDMKTVRKYYKEYRAVCSGDSGGAFAADNKLIGIVSHTMNRECGSRNPSVYTNVYRFLKFINEIVGN